MTFKLFALSDTEGELIIFDHNLVSTDRTPKSKKKRLDAQESLLQEIKTPSIELESAVSIEENPQHLSKIEEESSSSPLKSSYREKSSKEEVDPGSNQEGKLSSQKSKALPSDEKSKEPSKESAKPSEESIPSSD